MVFDRKITLLKREELPNLMGEVEVSYSVITPTHAEKVWKRGGEQQSANQQVGTTVESFRIRYRTGLTQVNAIEYNGELWDVRSIQEEERNKYLVLECERKDSQTDIATVVNGLILTEDGLYYLVTEDETYYLQQETA
jgi:SPP1 family predicted phage head-tail adaptor